MPKILTVIAVFLAIKQILAYSSEIFDDGMETKFNPFSVKGIYEDDIGQTILPNSDDDETLTFQLFDINDEEMATYMKIRFASNPDEEKTMLLDTSSFMTVLFHRDTLNATTTITYRDDSFSAIIKQNEEIIVSGYNGPYNQKNPAIHNYKMRLDIGHALLEADQKQKFSFDGIIGLASVSNNVLTFSFMRQLLDNGYIKSESFRFNEVYLNTSAEIYQSSITFGFPHLLNSDDYLIINNTLPKLPDSDISKYNIYRAVLLNVGLREVDILNFFDISDFEKNETAIIDSGISYVQLPDTILKYFDDTFFNDNCKNVNNFYEGSCRCVGGDYGSLPEIDFRFENSLKYFIKPIDYMSPPKINTTTKEPYCRLRVYSYWANNYPKLAGLGKLFINKYSLYIHVFRSERIVAVGFKTGQKYTSFSLIVPIIVYYFFVISILSSLSIWLSIK